eukprot:jgi/Tetstr1/464677/TSEL_009429.t1
MRKDPPVVLSGVRELATRYKGVLLDQFGVLHDGKRPYPHALPAVRQMAEQGQRLLILSNSSRRAWSSGALGKLAAMGFEETAFVGAITSGEVTHQSLANRSSPWWEALGSRCLHVTWGARGAISLEGLALQVTPKPNEAQFVLAHGTEAVGMGDGKAPEPRSLAALKNLLQEAAGHKLPMVVANPDIVTVSGSDLVTMPGTLAQWYDEFGGEVHLMGKPAPVIYEGAMALLGLDAAEILAVGDSLEHDIRGAQSAGVASAFICAGIHADETLTADGDINMDGLLRLCEKHSAWPDYVLPHLAF